MATASEKYVDDAPMPHPVDVMCGDLFDHIDDLLDFPNDDDVQGMDDYRCGPAPPAPGPAITPPLPPLQADGLLGGGGGGRGDSTDGSGDGAGGAASAFHREEERLVPWDDRDIAELEWLSNFFDDSDSFTADFPKCTTTAAIGNNNSGNSKEDSPFRTSSPVSVLEPNSLSIGGSGGGGSSSSSSSFSSSSGTSGGCSGARAQEPPPISHLEPILVVPARARSKRPRPAAFSSRPNVTIPFRPSYSDNIPTSTPVASSSSQSESFGESNPGPATMKQKKKKKKKKSSSAGTAAGGDEAPPVRKCVHCEIQKTPQWRAGPMGPKTLCNACGVRYKSGRLFPEYRPAASPTFVPALHSNSHKKVVEMRIKASQRAAAAGLPSLESASKDSCDLLAYIRRRE